MLTRSCVLAAIAASAAGFAIPSSLPGNGLQLRSTSACGLSSLSMVNEDRRDGFGGGKEAIKQVIEKRDKSNWGEGYGGSKGDLYKGPSSFEEYLKKRAAESGGKVKDAAGNDITNVKPTYEIAEGTWGAPETVKETSPFDWVDKSVTGFEKQDTKWLGGQEQEEWRKQKDAEKAQKEAEIEARMQKWLADAAKKAEGK